jgi:hypothetical protein
LLLFARCQTRRSLTITSASIPPERVRQVW